MKNLAITACALLLGASFAQAQETAPDADSLRDRLAEGPLLDRLPEDLASEVEAFRAERQQLRDTLRSEYLEPLGEDATAEERREAVEAFRGDFADEIAANREAARETLREVREVLPERPERPDIDIRDLIHKFRTTQKRLKAELRHRLAELPDDASREEVRRVMAEFKEEFADVIARQEELKQKIRELLAERGDFVPEELPGAELSPEFRELAQKFRQERRALAQAHREARQRLRDLDPEERRAEAKLLRDELKADLDALKEQRRQLIRDRLDETPGDRRPGE